MHDVIFYTFYTFHILLFKFFTLYTLSCAFLTSYKLVPCAFARCARCRKLRCNATLLLRTAFSFRDVACSSSVVFLYDRCCCFYYHRGRRREAQKRAELTDLTEKLIVPFYCYCISVRYMRQRIFSLFFSLSRLALLPLSCLAFFSFSSFALIIQRPQPVASH